MSMKFIIIVTSSPLATGSANTAYHFCTAALTQGHDVLNVFFYGEGIYHLATPQNLPSDEIQFKQRWQDLANRFPVQLSACSAAAQRRGLDHMTREPESAIQLMGLGDMLAQFAHADRIIQL